MTKRLAHCLNTPWTFLTLILLLTCLLSKTLYGQEPTLIQRLASVPFTPVDAISPLQDFDLFGGDWRLSENGEVLTVKGDSGSRLTYNVESWQNAESGAIEVDLRFAQKSAGFSGICFKISGSSVGADAFNGYEIGFNPAENVVNLGAHRHNYERLQLIPYEIPIGRFFRLRVEFQRSDFSVYIDGKLLTQFHETKELHNDPLVAGTFTLRSWQNDVDYTRLSVQLGVDGKMQAVPWRLNQSFSAEYPETLALDEVPPFIYIARSLLNRPYSVGNDLWQSVPKRPGCAIRLVDPNSPEDPVKTIFEDPDGSIYDMNLSFDAATIYFSYRPKDFAYWNIWKIGVDGSNLTRLTSGPFFDVSPAELPDGRIVFVSDRRFGRTVCQPGPASNLFRMDADGSNITCVSMNTLSDFNPQPLPDGRVLFTRWEYVDRDLTYRQSLWTQNPEGTLYQLFYGNTLRDFGSILQARPIPGAPSSKVMATFTPHHGYPHGAIGVIDRSKGIEAGRDQGFVYWTREFPEVMDISREYAYRDPFPLDEERALCSYGCGNVGVLGANSTGSDLRYRIWLLDVDGQKRLLWEEPELDCFCPIALLETPRPPVLPTKIVNPDLKAVLRPQLKESELFSGLRVTDGFEPCEDYCELAERYNADAKPINSLTLKGQDVNIAPWGIPERMNLMQGDPVAEVAMIDVYQGLTPAVAPGSVKRLRIMEQIRKSEELYDRSFDQSPSMGVGTYYAKRCWGEVPVDEDGSAHFYAPALREIYFQALDEQGREIQRMTSAVQFMPGESVGCVGCHEDRDAIPGTAQESSRRPSAATRQPDLPVLPQYLYQAYEYRRATLGNVTLDAGVVDYVSLVQPVWDRYCTSCHDSASPAGGYDFSGDLTRFFNQSYESILLHSRSYRQADMLTGKMPKSQEALGKPLAQFYWLLFTTSAVNEPYTTGALASRLPDYLTAKHCGEEISADDLARVYFWLDSNAIYHGTYAHARPDSPGRRDRWAPLDGKGRAKWFEEELLPIYQEKCASCHGNLLGGNHDLEGVHDAVNIDWIGRFAWLNLTRAELSKALLAHLPREEGGWGISTQPDAPTPSYVFTTRQDDAWQTMLHAIEQGCADAQARPDADQPGFARARPEP
ncbi:MAG: hypothetical protein Q4G03_02245 [Planctomycetia bacterium]|nr:hypothetical protein [Planctomycetia bacterium]